MAAGVSRGGPDASALALVLGPASSTTGIPVFYERVVSEYFMFLHTPAPSFFSLFSAYSWLNDVSAAFFPEDKYTAL